MKCQRCKSDRVVEMILYLSPDDGDKSEYKGLHCSVDSLFDNPEMLNKKLCFECGQMQGTFPIPEKKVLKHCYEIEEPEEPQVYDMDYITKRERELEIDPDEVSMLVRVSKKVRGAR